MKKQIVVVGAGIAGLSAAVYAQKCGFDVTVLESHSIPGGNCTSWKRKGYRFEGAMHWLTGSGKNEPLYRVWEHIGALNDDVTVHYPEPFKVFYYKNAPICLYRNLTLAEKHLCEISPEDAKELKIFCNYVRKVQKLVMPIFDIKGLKVTKKNRKTLKMLFNYLSANRSMKKASKITPEEYLSRFKHEGIRELFSSLAVEKYSATWLYFSMANRARGDAGFPEGGSLPFVERIVKTLKDNGGKIILNTRVTKVITENGKAAGVQTDDRIYPADGVIIAADTMQMEHLFDIQPQAQWLDQMRSTAQPTMCTFISLGIDADLTMYNKNFTFKLETPIVIANKRYEYVTVNNYANMSGYSPEGKAAVTVFFLGDCYDFWKNAKEKGSYKNEKEKVAESVISVLTAHMPEIANKVEVYDVATPLTYERYCANWKGSWMTMMAHNMKKYAYPPVVSNLSGIYFAGHRMRAPGGLPVAAMSGRTAVQYLCRDTDTLFISEK